MIERTADDSGVFRGIVWILVLGVALGVTYNWMGLRGDSWGVSWIGKSRLDDLPTLGEVGSGIPPADVAMSVSSAGYGAMDDPMAIGTATGVDLPAIPDLDRPIQMQLDAVQKFVEARAALIIDAREPDEFAAGHIPGSVNIPYDAIEPDRLESLSTDGKPIIVYCGGGTCEISMDLAFDLIFAGHSKVLVYMGGFPEWEAAGNPVITGEGA